MKVTLGSLNIDVAGPVDAALVQRAADEVNRRIEDVESRSSRIDTMGFALQAALSLAMDLEQVQQDRDDDAVAMAKALQRIADSLKSLVEDLTAEE